LQGRKCKKKNGIYERIEGERAVGKTLMKRKGRKRKGMEVNWNSI
jgi:hypothetical protein